MTAKVEDEVVALRAELAEMRNKCDRMEMQCLRQQRLLKVQDASLNETMSERVARSIEHSQKMESLGLLSGGIAHDFNNLLLAILGNADLASLEAGDDSPAQPFLDHVVQTAQRAADLCSQMLAYSGRAPMEGDLICLGDTVREISHLLSVSISKNTTLLKEFASGLPAVRANSAQISQVVMNLVINASEALGDEPGTVRLRTGQMFCDVDYFSDTYSDVSPVAGDYVFFEVSDTGSGMDESLMDAIFEPYYTTKKSGTGLGLSAVLGIVRAHKGAIKVTTAKGSGTTFKVLLPVILEAVPIAPVVVEKPKESEGKGFLLMVDDEELILELGSKVLRRAGYEVLEARNGLEAVAVFEERVLDIEVVILDLTMPKMGGLEAMAEMQRLRPDVQVLLSSGYTENETSELAEFPETVSFIQKPYRPALLVESVQNILARV